jgi:hypothetical protein
VNSYRGVAAAADEEHSLRAQGSFSIESRAAAGEVRYLGAVDLLDPVVGLQAGGRGRAVRLHVGHHDARPLAGLHPPGDRVAVDELADREAQVLEVLRGRLARELGLVAQPGLQLERSGRAAP